MTPEQIRLVQSSWSQIGPIADHAVVVFYGKLFHLAPEARAMFPDDLAAQRKNLAQTLNMIVTSLEDTDKVVGAASRLGSRHHGYGVTREQYDLVGKALVSTLQACLGADFTPECRDAWIEAYGLLSEVMIGAPRPPAEATVDA